MKDQSYVRYSAKIEGFKFDNEKFAINNPVIESVSLKTEEDGRTILSFAIHHGKSFEDGLEHTKELVEKTLDKIAFICRTKVNNLSLHSGYNDSTKTTILYVFGGCIIGGYTVRTISNLDSFINVMKMPDNHIQSTYYKNFRLALQKEDPVESYMSLYRIIYEINKSQLKVDNFIRANEPTVELRWSLFAKKYETIYTRLRNEVEHPDLNADLERTYREIKTKVEQLKFLTKKAIYEGHE